MFSATVPAIRCDACGTKVTFRAHSRLDSWPIGRPSASTAPESGSRSPSRSWTNVDFPPPVGPTIPDHLTPRDGQAKTFQDRFARLIGEPELVDIQLADGADRLSAVVRSTLAVAVQRLMQIQKEGRRGRDPDVGGLDGLPVAQRSQHHEDDGAERREVRGVRIGDQRQGGDKGQVGQHGVDGGDQGGYEGQSSLGVSRLVNQVGDSLLGLILHVEDVKLEAELGRLTKRSRELHADVRRPR